MRIGIDCRTILNPNGGEYAGIAHYTLHLVDELTKTHPEDTFVLFFNTIPETETIQNIVARNNVETVTFSFHRFKRMLPFVYAHGLVALTIGRQKLDLFHGPANFVPLGYGGRSVITIHDLAIYEYPEWFPSESPFSQKMLVPMSAKNAEHVIAVSQSTADAVRECFTIPQEQLSVVYEGGVEHGELNEEQRMAVREKFDIHGDFILFLGTIEPRKNVYQLIEAFSLIQQARPSTTTLVLAGKTGWKEQAILDAMEKSTASDQIQVLGYITAEEKVALMEECTVFAFPSLWEGFGLPVLEAMSVGASVLTSHVSALPEIGGEAVEYVDPWSVESIRDGLEKLLGNGLLREDLSEKAKHQAAKFSWEKCAQETYEVYKRIVQP